eukprot:12216197-Alexandrium_andersonii.AAC.1
MSASLVGSEMCIRDSLRGRSGNCSKTLEAAARNCRKLLAALGRDEDHVTTVLVLKHRQSRAARCWVVPSKGCLLYTSPSPRD